MVTLLSFSTQILSWLFPETTRDPTVETARNGNQISPHSPNSVMVAKVAAVLVSAPRCSDIHLGESVSKLELGGPSPQGTEHSSWKSHSSEVQNCAAANLPQLEIHERSTQGFASKTGRFRCGPFHQGERVEYLLVKWCSKNPCGTDLGPHY